MKLASGIAPVPEMLDAGINVGLGTDSNASNNALNFLREVHVAGLLHKLFLENASAMTAQQLLDMMTINGARAIGMEKEIGSIEVGKKADIVLFNLSAPCLVPTTEKNIVSNIVYSANPAAIDYVIVNGEIKVEHGRFNRCSEIAEMAENAAKKFL
jgi:5-methylthioadenosine/S-adenosylhomocysteine deaminase